ncbi:hypothetical protein, partial [Streptomyces venezuelae]|uniref:hypothetical protein n=1 Tax=Streptomyces venezuelae TaxID=54571 RepID=UPI001F2771F0
MTVFPRPPPHPGRLVTDVTDVTGETLLTDVTLVIAQRLEDHDPPRKPRRHGGSGRGAGSVG